MKKILLSAISVAILSSGMVQAASTGTITFNGELTAHTCDVIVDGQAADATVVLPTVSTNQLQTAAKTAGDTSFVMVLKNCHGEVPPDIRSVMPKSRAFTKTASAFFEAGASVDLVTGRLKNMTGSATNVSLQLLDASSPSQAVIQAGNQNQVLNTTYKYVSSWMGSSTTTLPYTVRYYAEAPTTAGTVVSNVVYTIQYQ